MGSEVSLIERLKEEIANPDTSGAPYVNDTDLLAECLVEILMLEAEVERLQSEIQTARAEWAAWKDVAIHRGQPQ